MARLDYDRAAASYDEGRAFPLAVFAEWRDRLAPYLTAEAPAGAVLDVGAGTGIWAEALAQWFHVPLVALEPAAEMRAAAAAKRLPASVTIVGGDAQAVPLRASTCQAAWLSTVIHHIVDLSACAEQLRRVLQPGGHVLIRNSFPGRQDEIPLFRYFPGAQRVADTFPTVDQTVTVFARSGFSLVSLERVHERRYGSLADWLQRIQAMRRSDSTLVPLGDSEFADGLDALRADIEAGKPVPPIGLDLMVLQSSR